MIYNFTTKQFNKHKEEIEDILYITSILSFYVKSNLDMEEFYKIFSVLKVIVKKLDNLVVILDDIEIRNSKEENILFVT